MKTYRLRKQTEDALQASIVKWWWLMAKRKFGVDGRLLVHAANGGRRDVREALKFQRMGVVPGFPDLALFVPRNGCHGLMIELKNGKTGRLSPAQKEMLPLLESQGYRVAVCRSFDEATETITNYLTTE